MRIRNGNGHLCWWYFRFLLYSPLFFGRSGGFISAPLLATMYGFAAWGFGGSHTAGYIAAAIAFPLPLLWSLNKVESWRLGRLARCGSGVATCAQSCSFFAILTLFVGMGLSVGGVEELWAAPLFALLLATGVAVFLFPGQPAHYLMLFLRGFIHFIFVSAVAYSALLPIYPQPTLLAVSSAGLCSLCWLPSGCFWIVAKRHVAASKLLLAAGRWGFIA